MIKKYILLLILAAISCAVQASSEEEKKYIISGCYQCLERDNQHLNYHPGTIYVLDVDTQNIIHFKTFNGKTCGGLAYFEYDGAMRILARLWNETIVIYNLDGSIFKTFRLPLREIVTGSLYQAVADVAPFATIPLLFPTAVNILRIGDDNMHILVGYRCGKIAVWDVSTGEYRLFDGNQSSEEESYGITAFSLFTDNGTIKVAASSCDGSVCIYNFQTGEKLKTFTGFKNWVTSVAVFKDNDGFNVVAGAQDRTIQCWNIESGQQKYIIKTLDHYSQGAQILPQSGQVEGLVLFKNDSKIFLAAIASNLDVVIYNAQTGDWVKSLIGHTNYISDLRVYQDRDSGKTKLVSASYDETVRLWDFESSEQECVFDQKGLAVRNLSLFEDTKGHVRCTAALGSLQGVETGALGFIDLTTKENSVGNFINAWMQAVACADQIFEPKSLLAISPNVPIGSYIGMYNLKNIQVIDVSSNEQQ